MNVDLQTDATLQVDISDALSERDKVKFTVHTKVRLCVCVCCCLCEDPNRGSEDLLLSGEEEPVAVRVVSMNNLFQC